MVSYAVLLLLYAELMVNKFMYLICLCNSERGQQTTWLHPVWHRAVRSGYYPGHGMLNQIYESYLNVLCNRVYDQLL